MPKTKLEMVTELITAVEKSLEEAIKEIEEKDPSDPRVSYLNHDIDRITERLDFLKDQLFTSISMQILERENTPGKKIKMLNNLVKVYEEFK